MENQKKLVLFDFDGTIVDSMWAWDELGKNTINERNLPPLRNYDSIIRTMSVPDFSVFLADYYPSLAPAKKLMAEWHEKMLVNYLNKIFLKKGVVSFLNYLRDTNHVIYLASATHFSILSKALDHFEIKSYFDYIVTEEQVGISKRNPMIYNLCAEKANCPKDKIYLFEDAIHAIETAKGIGINVCAVADASMRNSVDEIKHISDLYVEDFSDLMLLCKFLGE